MLVPDGRIPDSLVLDGIKKAFDSRAVLRGVSFSAPAGSVVGLVGDNGAGKSTLLKIIAGCITQDAGDIGMETGGQRAPLTRCQTGYLPQRVRYAPEMELWEHAALFEASPAPLLNRRSEIGRFRRSAAAAGPHLEPRKRLRGADVGERRLAALLGLLHRHPAVLLLDEPSAGLSASDREVLLRIVDGYRKTGGIVLMASHHPDLVAQLTDMVVSLEAGQVSPRPWRSPPPAAPGSKRSQRHEDESPAGRWPANAEIVPQPATSEAGDQPHLRTGSSDGEPAIELSRVMPTDDSQAISIVVRRGEIGVLHPGDVTELSQIERVVAGEAAPASGEVRILGRPVSGQGLAATRSLGLAYCPLDRDDRGDASSLAVWENAAAGNRQRGRFDIVAAKRAAAQLIERAGLQTPTPDSRHAILSGGMRQRLQIARELTPPPPAAILSNPTIGLDVAGSAVVYGLIADAAKAGTAVLILSTEHTPDAPWEQVGGCSR